MITLPVDPDASARRLRAGLAGLTGSRPAVVITDSFGRAWRTGQCDVAIGCAGLEPLDDWRGRTDIRGRELHATVIAVADELAAGADLARSKDAMQPAILVRGAGRWVTDDDGPGVAPLLRDPEDAYAGSVLGTSGRPYRATRPAPSARRRRESRRRRGRSRR